MDLNKIPVLMIYLLVTTRKLGKYKPNSPNKGSRTSEWKNHVLPYDDIIHIYIYSAKCSNSEYLAGVRAYDQNICIAERHQPAKGIS